MMPSVSNTVLRGLVALTALSACGDDGGGPADTAVNTGALSITLTNDPSLGSEGTAASEGETSVTGGSDSTPADTGDDEPKFDLGDTPLTGGPVDTGEIDCNTDPNNPDCKCSIPEHTACDNGTADLFNAMGLNCPGELQVQASNFGNAGAFGVRSNFGVAGLFNAREGSQFAVVGSGQVADLNLVTPNGDDNSGPTHCNDELGGGNDVGGTLPPPLRTNNVGGDCTQNPALLKTGDCSNTVQEQFDAGGAAFDYAELRFVLQVPQDVTSFSYDFAFFSTEYPVYYGTEYNDMYIGWLESEKWTGNISFDAMGNPISLNAGFLDHRDDNGQLPALAGTCMRQHAGTNWLQTTAGVTPGETITVVFAIFDLSDPVLDSYIFLDNFKWGCEPTGKPTTMPPS